MRASFYARLVPELVPRFYRHQQQREDEQRIAAIILETGCGSDEAEAKVRGPRLLSRSADGHDAARLRGLPAIGRNVSGAIRDTDPVRSLLAKEARGELRR
jgi:hypothetical protein